ncbi:hypothetical protein KY311_04820 [Candidatus Woesearchaeota archaeon]|nr:hypothetical protein [Candidatus Woesearchaeota archaeon]
MKEKTLLKIALISTILGIFSLLVLSEFIELGESTISQIKEMDGGVVRLTGIVEKVIEKDKVIILTVSKKETIDVVVFDEVSFEKGQHVDVIGEVDKYNGKKEIIAKEVK